MQPIYLDNAATTPIDPRVADAMRPFQEGDYFGNPSSTHRFGRDARAELEKARALVASAIGAEDSEIIFTSGGTEADFLALSGIVSASGRKSVTVSAIEHHAILHNCEWLEEIGYHVTRVHPRADGLLSVEDVIARVGADTGLVSIMWVNNETGVCQPIEQLAYELWERGIPLHSDAVQALVKFPIDVKNSCVSSLSFSGHKLYGPKGVGALYLRKGTPYRSSLRGGSQERNRRAGTENLAGIIGFACALNLQVLEREKRLQHIVALRNRFTQRLSTQVDHLTFHGSEDVSAHIVNVAIHGTLAETVLMNLDLAGVAASSGSACTAGSIEPSHVLLAQGISLVEAKSSLRFSFSSTNTLEEIDRAVDHLSAIVKRLRERSGFGRDC